MICRYVVAIVIFTSLPSMDAAVAEMQDYGETARVYEVILQHQRQAKVVRRRVRLGDM